MVALALPTRRRVLPGPKLPLQDSFNCRLKGGDVSKDVPTHDELRNIWLASQPLTIFDGSQWWRFGKTHWEQIALGQVSKEIAEVVDDAKDDGIRPTKGVTQSVLGMAQDKTFVEPALFDADPNFITVQNGILNLTTRHLRGHIPELYLTSVLPYHFDKQATAPRWQYYLDTTIEPCTVSFLQEFAGYCLTTDTKLETALWLCGPRGSGKSTFLLGLTTMLGKRAGMLGLAEIERSRFALCDIPGKTLLFATEQPVSALGATSLINRLISGEPIRVERKFRDAVEIIPRAKIAWAMNELPAIHSASDGIFRRIKIVEFAKRSTPMIPEIKEEIQREGAGILNWALAGLDRLRKRGQFLPPAHVEEATQDYERTSDFTAAFVEDDCEMGEDYSEQSSDLYSAYAQWCKANGYERTKRTSTAIAEEWRRLGFVKFMSGGYVRWRGVRIRRPEHRLE